MSLLRAAPIVLVLVAAACAGVTREGILKEQDLRVSNSALLKRAASSPSPEIRSQAYLAMGRIQSAAYLAPLLDGLHDADPAASEQAVFSLGQLGLAEPALSSMTLTMATLSLGRFVRGVDRNVQGSQRLAAIEAIGKTGGPEAESLLTAKLGYPGDLLDPPFDQKIRGEAALALFRQRLLKRVPEYSSATVAALIGLFEDRDPGVRWRAVYAFSRFGEPRAAEALSSAAADADPTVRLFACRALGLLKDAAPTENLVKAAADPDYLVRTEAVRALGLAGQADLLPQKIFSDPSPHVRAAAVDALAGQSAYGQSAIDSLDRYLKDESRMVRGQALLALPKMEPKEALGLLDQARYDPNWWLRSKAYEALGEIPGSERLLKGGIQETDARAASSALAALAKSSATEVDGILESVLRDPHAPLEMAGTAAEAAKDRKSVALLKAERAAYGGSLARQYPEFADDLAEAYGETLKAHPEVNAAPLPPRPAKMFELSPHIYDRLKPATVVLETDKGSIELSLAVDEAPIHAATFMESVKKGLYNGTIWHRVVSGFVVQGGDPRGSGWGDGGVSLRDEINRLPFARGAVGMPKAGKDTGGCQLFITHVPTPHLDGRYTVFGRVVSGMDAVDRLEPGDRIVRAYLK